MKTLSFIFAAAFIGIAGGVQAQDINPSEVPNQIRQAFDQNFPTAEQYEWEKEPTGYKVEFKMENKGEQEVWFNEAGQILRSEREVFLSELPMAIVSQLRSDYTEYHVEDVEEIVVDGVKTYRLELENNRTDREVKLNFDAEGNPIGSK